LIWIITRINNNYKKNKKDVVTRHHTVEQVRGFRKTLPQHRGAANLQ